MVAKAKVPPELVCEWSDRNMPLTPDMSMQSPGEMYGGNVGDRENVLASNEKDTDGAKYMCGFTERNELFERCSDCMVSNDYAGKERKMNCRRRQSQKYRHFVISYFMVLLTSI